MDGIIPKTKTGAIMQKDAQIQKAIEDIEARINQLQENKDVSSADVIRLLRYLTYTWENLE